MIKTKGVAFNLDDPDQKKILYYAMSRTNFSAFVKMLISNHMQQEQNNRDSERNVLKSNGTGTLTFKLD